MDKKLLLMLLLLSATISSFAYDFEVDGIYYNKNNANTVGVTYEGVNCYSIKTYSGDVTIPEKVTYNNITYSVTSIGKEAFCSCTELTSITMPNTITEIGYCSFCGCAGLTSISIPNSVKSIGEHAFEFCLGLESVTLPNTLKYIGQSTFRGSKGLKDIYSYITRPDTVKLGLLSFYDVNVSSCVLHVLSGTRSLYQSASQWGDFANIVEDLTDGISNTDVDKSLKCYSSNGYVYVTSEKILNGIEIYSIDGKLIMSSAEKSKFFVIPINDKTCIVKSGAAYFFKLIVNS